jgi:hypothetical protein
MDKRVAAPAPYFDAGEVGRELMEIIAAQKGQPLEARPAVLDKLKQLLRDARAEAERQLAADLFNLGQRCAPGTYKLVGLPPAKLTPIESLYAEGATAGEVVLKMSTPPPVRPFESPL